MSSSIDLQNFAQLFFDEAAEHCTALEAGLLQLERDPTDAEAINAIFRAAHSIKGASGSFGFHDVARFTHVLENVLEQVRSQGWSAAPPSSLLLRSADVLGGLLAAAREGAEPPAEADAVRAELEQHLMRLTPAATAATSAAPGAPAAAAAPAGQSWRVRFMPDPGLFGCGSDPLLLLRDLGRIGSCDEMRLDLATLPELTELDPERCYLGFEARVTTTGGAAALGDVFAFVEDGSTIEIQPVAGAGAPAATAALAPAASGNGSAAAPSAGRAAPARGAGGESSSIRVATDKVDRIIDLVGELVIAQSMVAQAIRGVSGESLPQLREAVASLERYTRDLQERVMSVRTLPIGNVFQRFPRLVRDLAAALGKKVELELVGEEIELDKSVIEGIGDPLTHLVRNAIDHGIETPEERARAGKPEVGRLRLRAAHQGGGVLIEVSDDGRGLDGERIRQKAIERGLVDSAATLTTEQMQELILLPGFSTAQVVSDVSGRGVGMDVVKRNVQELNGSLRLQSESGRGTTCQLQMPLTLAILDGLTLRVGQERFIIPLVSVIESFQPKPGDVRTICGAAEVLRVRNETVPLVRLRERLGLAAGDGGEERQLVTLVESGGHKIGLWVDELLGQAQVVIKSLETHFRRVDTFLGATILGDGNVALILDVQAIARSVTNTESRAA